MMDVRCFNPKSLEQTCFDTMKDSLRPETCISLWQCIKAWNIPIFIQLQNELFHFICGNFEQVSVCEEFLQLVGPELAEILAQDDLNVTQESTAYQSVLRWIHHMPEERQEVIATLLAKVRLGLMDRSYIMDNVLTNDVVKTSPESLLLVSKTLQVMSQPSLLRSEPGINTLFCRRLPNAVLLMVGIFSETIEAFDSSTSGWTTLHPHRSLEDRRIGSSFLSMVFLDGLVYSVGGTASRCFACYNTVWRLNPVAHTWQEMSPMQESRHSVSVSALKAFIYAMGGCGDHGLSLRTAERYQPHINQWTFIASMNEGRSNASCSALDDKMYICGGWSNGLLNTAECYDPDTDQWTLIAPMTTRRRELGVIAYMGHILAVGGSDGSTHLRSAEVYDPVTNAWYHVPEMVHAHSGFGVAVMNGQVYVVSCSTGKKIVERYDYSTNTWSVAFSGVARHFDAMSCCVISGLPNMAEYCPPREPIIPGTQS